MGLASQNKPMSGGSAKPSPQQYAALLALLSGFSLIMGYAVATQPNSTWRFFSWHPFLMTCGMVGLAGISAVTKKLGGYANTKLHAVLAWSSVLSSLGGLYIIYQNKNQNGKPHLQTPHAMLGTFVVFMCVALGFAGSVFLHPDFGVAKTNSTIRAFHKYAARGTLGMAWITALGGIAQLTQSKLVMASYALPLVALVPFVLI